MQQEHRPSAAVLLGIQGTYPDVYEDGVLGGDGERSVEFLYRPGIPPPSTIDLQQFTTLLERDRRARLGSGEPSVVWHDPAFGSFAKNVTLDGRTLTVSYTGGPARPSRRQRVLRRPLGGDDGSSSARASGRRRPRDHHHAGNRATVSVEPGPGCAFSPDMTATIHDRLDRYLRGHRVLTDRLDLVCPGGGAFSYTITLP